MIITAIKNTIRLLPFLYRKTDYWRKKVVGEYLKNHEIAKLQIGCGPYPLEGWLNTDVSSRLRKGSPMFMDAGKPFPLPDTSFDYVYSEHLLSI